MALWCMQGFVRNFLSGMGNASMCSTPKLGGSGGMLPEENLDTTETVSGAQAEQGLAICTQINNLTLTNCGASLNSLTLMDR